MTMTASTETTETTETTQPLLCADDPLIDMTFINAYTGMTDKWFYKLIGDGLFHKPIKLGRSSRWRKSKVENWMRERITHSRGH